MVEFPLLDPNNLEESFEKMYTKRQKIYEKVSFFKVKIHGKTDRQVLDELKGLGLFSNSSKN